MDNKVDIGGKLEMYDFDRRWWLQVVISEETFPIESEFMHICELATLGGNNANELLQELCGIGNSSKIFDPNMPCTKGHPRGALN